MSALRLILVFFSGIMFLVLSSGHELLANDPEFRASAPPVVTAGRAFNYTITGNENIRGSVQLPDIDGLRLMGGPSTYMSTQSSYINGRMENVTTVTYTYSMIALKEGTLTIPPATIKLGNKSLVTNPVELTVVAQQSSASQPPAGSSAGATQPQTTPTEQNYFIRLIPSKRSVYLGEQFLMDAKVYTSERLSFSEVKYPEFEGFWKHEIEAEQQATREIIDGKEYLSQIFKRDLLLPQKSGTLKINPLEVTVLVQKRVRSQRRSLLGDLFDDPFFDSFENVPVILNSNALNIEVKPLPAGAPAGFDGAVGQFSLDLSNVNEQAKVNEAVTLLINLKGKGNLSLLKAPKIAVPPDVEIFEPKTSRNVSHTLTGSSGSVSFEYLIIPRYAGKIRIPPLEFSFFNPEKGNYQTLKTREININVEEGEASGQAAIGGGQTLVPGIMREKVTNIGTDILFIKTDTPAFIKADYDLAGTTLFKLVFPVGILAYILLVILYRKKIRENNDLAYTRNKQARRKAEKRLRAARKFLGVNNKLMYEEIHKVLWEYLSDKLNVPRSELSRENIEQGLKKYELSPQLLEMLWNIIDECEMSGYATGSASQPETIYSNSEELLYKFEQILK
jgi:hypothetical protein